MAATLPSLAQSRYTDIKEEPVGKLLVPIKDYDTEQLLPLEEAVAPITHLFIDLEEYVYIAKHNCQQPEDGLTQDESAALHLYTMQFSAGDSLYVILNQTLRSERRDFLQPFFKFLKVFMTALFKLDFIRATVWRGVRGVDLSQKYKTGVKFAWWGVSSCTTTLDILEKSDFLGKTGTRTVFSIECMNGKSVLKHSYFSESEKEVILMPGTYFEVMGQANPAEGLHIIHLKEIKPPFPMIKPPFVKQQQGQATPSGSSSGSIESSSITKSAVGRESDSSSYNTNSIAASVSSEISTIETATAALNLNKLQQKPRLCININKTDHYRIMTANDKYLLHKVKDRLCLIDVDGNEILNVNIYFYVWDMCWSSFLNQFLIPEYMGDSKLYSLDISSNNGLIPVLKLDGRVPSCSCYEAILLVSSAGKGSIIEVYEMTDSKLIRTYRPPVSCKKDQEIRMIRFNSNGTCVGVVLTVGRFPHYASASFELRQASNMKVVQIVNLGKDSSDVLALPNEQFLLSSHENRKLFLIDSNGQLKETIPYDTDVKSTAFLTDKKCLVIQTYESAELRFYDL
ncbi:unnamed protein product [Didymodactylos carnosus]|uniref:NAD(P)(+)--arginine ADP-ribosyltransferase n=1 Tax=Didymodactylos carnosus TaxID=1234261 RepID=A0A815EPK1_9BILA|nr:unnamed protein product [Didymodactylos carnosus]CAF1318114.1 unnamed protein product [Didymodactylos carnosus]CAF4054288.1 unnamed protein product [Didymodactylos carnosus]CAF4161608.1 unnamed protein product [Didymodactylos carnosus]